MKKTIKNTLVVMAMLGVITSYANLKPNSPFDEKVKTTMLTLDYVKQGQRLLIKSDNGTILYKESIRKTGPYHQEFDLTSLPNGDYVFEIDKDVEIQIIPFSINVNIVKFFKEKEITIFKPVVRAKDNKLLVSKLSLELQPMTLEIYYDPSNGTDFEKIYSEKIEHTKVIEKIYATDKNKPGLYKIITKSDGRVYTHVFTI